MSDMQYGFSLNLYENDGEMLWIAESCDLKGCVGQGATQEEAIRELKANESTWIETAKEFDIEIPPKSIRQLDDEYSGKLTLRLGKTLHKETAQRAKEEGLSINQYIMVALSKYNTTSSLTKVATRQIEICTRLFITPLQRNGYNNQIIGSEWVGSKRSPWSSRQNYRVQTG